MLDPTHRNIMSLPIPSNTTQIPNHSNYYITMTGQIWSVKRNIWLKPSLGPADKYYKVNLGKNNRNKRIHQLVALTYLVNPDPVKFTCIDHINQNRLDNSMSNLRFCTPRENSANMVKRTQGKTYSASTGVTFDSQKHKWRARIFVSNISRHLGYFETEREAATAYLSILVTLP